MRNFITAAYKTSTRFWRDWFQEYLLQNVNQLPTSKDLITQYNTIPLDDYREVAKSYFKTRFCGKPGS